LLFLRANATTRLSAFNLKSISSTKISISFASNASSIVQK
jgi:hypothetical protein